MRTDSEGRADTGSTDLREITRWARRYAQNRTLPVVVGHLVFIVGGLVFAGLSCLTVHFHLSGQRAYAILSVSLLGGLALFWLWFSFATANRMISRASDLLYRHEGKVTGGPWLWEEGQKAPWPAFVLLLIFAAAHTDLGFVGVLPIEYLQPISAIYVVPIMVYIGLTRTPEQQSPFMVLWPVLYGIHAILIAVGVPISRGPAFDVLFPVVGYGLIASLAGHIYSRFALRRLRALAAIPDCPEHEDE